MREIEGIRGRLDAGMQELERRLPQPGVWAKRLVGAAVVGGVGSFVIFRVAKRAHSRTEPARASGAVEDGRWKRWAAAGAGAWLAVQLLELRELQRLNRRLVATRV